MGMLYLTVVILVVWGYLQNILLLNHERKLVRAECVFNNWLSLISIFRKGESG